MELVEAFVRLARADFSVRLERNFKRDLPDTLAYFVNLIAEELERLMAERERDAKAHEAAVLEFNEAFLGLAAGNFSVRVKRTGTGEPLDVLAYLINNTAVEVGDAFGELQAQRQVLATILDSMIDGVLLLDRNGIIRRANGAIARLLKRTPAELEGHSVRTFLAEAEAPLVERLPELVATGPFRDRETRFCAADGELLALTVNGSPNRDDSGALTGVVLVARDDRELKRAQAQLQMTERLAAMGRVAAGVAHEINNPLAYVIANLEFIDEELAQLSPSTPPDDATLAEMGRATRASLGGASRVQQIVKDLKSLSRVEGEGAAGVDVNRVVETAVTMLSSEIRPRATLKLVLGEVPPVVANEGRLVQVLLNLVQNAAHAIAEGAPDHNEIRVSTGLSDEHGMLFVEVSDSGGGIAAENLNRIFDAFFTTKPVGLGTGLGLSICHQIVSALGGRIQVTSAPGAGSTFTVLLPVSTARPPGAPPSGAAARPAASSVRKADGNSSE